MMVEVIVQTSKSRRLWATEHWKCLFDSLCRGGARHDPRRKYPDLAEHLEPLIEEREGRYFPRPGTALYRHDDTQVRVIRLTRVTPGLERIELRPAELPITSTWPRTDVPFFGTIGDSKYEAQSKSNQQELARRLEEDRGLRSLSLSFTLSQHRRDRDLDNLYDGLVPLFNRLYPEVDVLLLVKEHARPEPGEALGLWTFVAP